MDELKETYRRLNSVITRWVNYVYPRSFKYSEEDFNKRERFKEDYAVIADTLDGLLHFDTVIDVGCAQGFLIDPLIKKNYDVKGVEKSEEALSVAPKNIRDRISIGDFSDIGGKYDLVCCIEVAEHIRPGRSQELVTKLCSLSELYIYFTAAPPGQAGCGHINCRPHTYWQNKFANLGFYIHDEKTSKMKKRLSRIKKAHWLVGNSMIFSNETD